MKKWFKSSYGTSFRIDHVITIEHSTQPDNRRRILLRLTTGRDITLIDHDIHNGVSVGDASDFLNLLEAQDNLSDMGNSVHETLERAATLLMELADKLK
jgi:hypothetical protein